MDIQKEREAFEVWVIENLAEGRSMSWEDWCWKAWQAAKANAVPEGFVVVNKEDLVKVLNCVSDDWLIETESLEEFKNIESLVQLEIESMIEAQEPK